MLALFVSIYAPTEWSERCRFRAAAGRCAAHRAIQIFSRSSVVNGEGELHFSFCGHVRFTQLVSTNTLREGKWIHSGYIKMPLSLYHSVKCSTVFFARSRAVLKIGSAQRPRQRAVLSPTPPACLTTYIAMIKTTLGANFILINNTSLGPIHLCVFSRLDVVGKIGNSRAASVSCGIGNVIHNKGGVAVSFSIYNTSIAFVSAHLAANEGNDHLRSVDYHRIDTHLAESLTATRVAAPIPLRSLSKPWAESKEEAEIGGGIELDFGALYILRLGIFYSSTRKCRSSTHPLLPMDDRVYLNPV